MNLYDLSELEKFTLSTWLGKPKQKRLMKDGGSLALVFKPGVTSRTVMAKVQSSSAEEAEHDITEYDNF